MNGRLLTEAMDLLVEAEISYTANGHSYEPEIIEEMRNISDRIHKLYDKLRSAYVIIETKRIIEDLPGFSKIESDTKEEETVKELFESVDFAEFICPGGPLKNYDPYLKLQAIFENNLDVTIAEATKRMAK